MKQPDAHRVPLLPPIPPAARFVIAGLVIAGLVYLMTMLERPPTKPPERPPEVVVRVPVLDTKLLAAVRDDDREHRLQLEPEGLSHLLATAIDVGPTVAQALGMPHPPVPIAELRQNAATWRGRWLYYEGRIEQLSGPKDGHPIRGHGIHEATLRLAGGEAVMVAFSIAPAEPIQVGSWVRAEGFLMKLRDTTYPTTIDAAPMLVGRELLRDYEKWPPVTVLDEALLATVNDTTFLADDPIWRDIEEDQCEALWHLGAFARDTAASRTLAEWRKIGTLNAHEQHEKLRKGSIARGTPMRVFGSLIMRRTVAAPPNPAGIKEWTAAWVQVREYGGIVVPVWVPKRVADLPERCQLEVRGLFYRWLVYDTIKDTSRFAPLFVAADLHPYELQVSRTMDGIVLWLGGLAVLALLLILWSQRRAQKNADRHTQEMFERRRRLRANQKPAATTATPPPL